MFVVFGNQQVTGLFEKYVDGPLGFDTSKSADKYGVDYSGGLPGHKSNNASMTHECGESLNPSGSVRDSGDSSTRSGARRKRGRMILEDEDPLIYTVTQAFKTLLDAIKQSAPQPHPVIPPNLWTVMKQIPAFQREHIAHYYDYLCENPALSYAFLEMGLDDQMVWVSRYIKARCLGTSRPSFLIDASKKQIILKLVSETFQLFL
jgi:hypothetical protein